MPITELLEQNCKMYGNDICLVEINPEVKDKRRVTWKEYELIEPSHASYYRREITWNVFNEKANRFANLLLSRGVKKGDKVAILLMNCLEWLPIYFGILKTGALAVPLNFRYSSKEIEYCLDLSESDVLIFGPEFIGRIEEIADRIITNRLLFFFGENCPTFAEDYNTLTADCSSMSPNIMLTDKDDAAIYFSSGTTGFPKAILHNHESLMHSCKVEQNHHGQGRNDVFLCIPPLYHTGAKMHWFGSLLSGSKAILLKGTKPEYILDAVSREKCTIVWLLVPWAQDILEALDSGRLHMEDYELSQWRLMHIGAQPVPPSLIRHWNNIHKVGAIGVPGFGWEVKIIAPDGSPVKQGEVGELCVKGPGVMTCYYNDPKATDEVLKEDWLLTGDMAKQDEDGFYYLVDRKKDVIISGGENLYPVQIEDFIRTHNAVHDVAVIGLPDKRLGEIAAAIIELKPDMTCSEDEMNLFCTGLPRYKRPRKIIFDDIPRNPTGKIEKPVLRERYKVYRLVEAEINA